MMLGKDYMLAIVIVNYEGRCICRSRLETSLGGLEFKILSECVCARMCARAQAWVYVWVSSKAGRKFVSLMLMFPKNLT